MENNNVTFTEQKNRYYDFKRFIYTEEQIMKDNLNNIKDEKLRDAVTLDILNDTEPTNIKNYIEKYDEEKEKILYDLSLLENTSLNN